MYVYATPVHKFESKPCTRFFANSVVVWVQIMWLTTTLARGTMWVGPHFLVINVSHNRVEAPVADHLRDSPLDVDKYEAVQIFSRVRIERNQEDCNSYFGQFEVLKLKLP